MLLFREFFQKHLKHHISVEQLTVVELLLLGDEILASYIGIMISHSLGTNQDFMACRKGLFHVAQLFIQISLSRFQFAREFEV